MNTSSLNVFGCLIYIASVRCAAAVVCVVVLPNVSASYSVHRKQYPQFIIIMFSKNIIFTLLPLQTALLRRSPGQMHILNF